MSPIINPSGGGGGGSQPLPTKVYSIYANAAPLSVPNDFMDNAHRLPWAYVSDPLLGPNYFNLTVPTIPTVLADGIYAFAIEVQLTTPDAPGAMFAAFLGFDHAGWGDGPQLTLPLDSAGPYQNPIASLSATVFLAAGMDVRAVVGQSTSGNRNAVLWASVLKIA